MRGLPFNTREKEIIEFFKNIEIKRECIAFQYDHDVLQLLFYYHLLYLF